MIAKGVRFNAEKKQVGNYFSTKVGAPRYLYLVSVKTQTPWHASETNSCYDIRTRWKEHLLSFPVSYACMLCEAAASPGIKIYPCGCYASDLELQDESSLLSA